MKKLPIGISTFKEIIAEDYLYVDKTRDIQRLIDSGKYFFLSRPRRFGKSLLISSIKEIFSGERKNFAYLFIHDKITFKKHPVIHIDFSAISYSLDSVDFTQSLLGIVSRIAQSYNIQLTQSRLKDAFRDLIENLSAINKVVILIDEYDKPLVDYIDDFEKAARNREVLRDFYSVLKGCDEYIKFLFITGVSKFSKVSIFSGLNNLEDITIDNRFSTIAGITQDEMEFYFKDRIEVLADEKGYKKEFILENIRKWYNGYSWDGINRLYNPFSLLNLFSKNDFRNYWFETGTPTFLINSMKEKNIEIDSIPGKQVTNEVFGSFDIENFDFYSLLFQTGYLTIKSIEKNENDLSQSYILDYPNMEVQQSFLIHLLGYHTQNDVSTIRPVYLDLIEALKHEKIEEFIQILKSLLANIPYQLHIEEESYYHSVFYMILTLMGFNIISEVSTSGGRIDSVMEFDNKIYIIEFKYAKESKDLLKSAENGIKQIKEKGYSEKFRINKKSIVLLSIAIHKKEIEWRKFFLI